MLHHSSSPLPILCSAISLPVSTEASTRSRRAPALSALTYIIYEFFRSVGLLVCTWRFSISSRISTFSPILFYYLLVPLFLRLWNSNYYYMALHINRTQIRLWSTTKDKRPRRRLDPMIGAQSPSHMLHCHIGCSFLLPPSSRLPPSRQRAACGGDRRYPDPSR
jgi:hypothetical protein